MFTTKMSKSAHIAGRLLVEVIANIWKYIALVCKHAGRQRKSVKKKILTIQVYNVGDCPIIKIYISLGER